jgi:hypothetical protein
MELISVQNHFFESESVIPRLPFGPRPVRLENHRPAINEQDDRSGIEPEQAIRGFVRPPGHAVGSRGHVSTAAQPPAPFPTFGMLSPASDAAPHPVGEQR